MKLGKIEQARREGAKWALDSVMKNGLAATKKDFEWRGITNCPISTLSRSEIDKFQNDVKKTNAELISLMTCATLHDEFGFGEKRIHQFIKRFNTKVECIELDYASWEDYKQILAEEVGIDIWKDVNNKT